MRTRRFEEHNYVAFFDGDGKTTRFYIDKTKPLTPPAWPELYDVAINNKCMAGCPYCYTSAIMGGVNFKNILHKIDDFFGSMTMNQRPFQVAIGGAGEPTMHPLFIDVLMRFHKLGITPNYTTNGMHLSPSLIEATKKYVGGVAVSCHPHLAWQKAANEFIKRGIHTNLHIIISDENSVDMFKEIYDTWDVKYFVLLPYIAMGRAKPITRADDKLFALLDKMGKPENVAFGAFYGDELKARDYPIPLYDHESFSKYVVLSDPIKVYESSFETEE